MKNKKVTVTKKYIDDLKSQRDGYKEQAEIYEKDLNIFREFFVNMLKSNVQVLSKNQYIPASTIILDLSTLMNRVQRWYWS